MIAGPFYTYLHIRADDGLVFYVGKGCRSRANRTSGRSQHWNRVVAKHGLRVEIAAELATEREAFDHERQLIEEHRAAGAPLCNRTDGGEGCSGHRLSTESKAKIAAAARGRIIGPEHRAKIGWSEARRAAHERAQS